MFGKASGSIPPEAGANHPGTAYQSREGGSTVQCKEDFNSDRNDKTGNPMCREGVGRKHQVEITPRALKDLIDTPRKQNCCNARTPTASNPIHALRLRMATSSTPTRPAITGMAGSSSTASG